jgi:hypothetical protein
MSFLLPNCAWTQPVRALCLEHNAIIDQIAARLAAALIHAHNCASVGYMPPNQTEHHRIGQNWVRRIWLEIDIL